MLCVIPFSTGYAAASLVPRSRTQRSLFALCKSIYTIVGPSCRVFSPTISSYLSHFLDC